MIVDGHCRWDTAAMAAVDGDRTGAFVAAGQWVMWQRTSFGSGDC